MRIYFNNGYAVSIIQTEWNGIGGEVGIISESGDVDFTPFDSGEELIGIMTNVKKIIT